MPNSTVDDQDSSVLYAGPWTHYRRDQKGAQYDSSDWRGGTFSSCGGPGSGRGKDKSGVRGGPGCELRVSFVGTGAALYGDSNGKHGQFSCRLLDEEGQPEGLWGWFDGGSRWWWPYQHNVLLCSVTSIPHANHTLVLEVQPDQVPDGIALDYFTSTDEEPAGTARSWRSDLNDAVPPAAYRNTTATPFLPSMTASFSPAPSSTLPGPSSSSDEGVHTLAVGLGAGLGGLFALLAVLALAAYGITRKRRRRHHQLQSPRHKIASYDDDSDWFPEPASEAGQLGRVGGNRGGSSPSSAIGYDSPVTASGTGYDIVLPDGTRGPATHELQMPLVYPARPPYTYDDAEGYSSASASTSGTPLLGPVPALTAPSPRVPRRASVVPSGYPSRSTRAVSAVMMDLPPDATLEDPASFAER